MAKSSRLELVNFPAMTSLNLVGVATVSVSFITAAYYLLPSLSRYLTRVFTRRGERRASEDDEKPRDTAELQTNGSEERTGAVSNGVISRASCPERHKNGTVVNMEDLDAPLGDNRPIPRGFEAFVGWDMILKFEKQRQVKFQFFVVVLASDDDLKDLQAMNFYPHDASSPRQPLINNKNLTMPEPQNYHNYIVARFESCEYHSEEVVFGPKYNNPFGQLWTAYLKKNGGCLPKAIIMYSWNYPCARCTKLILSVLSREEYREASVLLAYSRIWDSEEGYPHVAEKNMAAMRCGLGAHIQQVEPPIVLQEAGSS